MSWSRPMSRTLPIWISYGPRVFRRFCSFLARFFAFAFAFFFFSFSHCHLFLASSFRSLLPSLSCVVCKLAENTNALIASTNSL